MKITSMGRPLIEFEYHDPERNEKIVAQDFAPGGVQIEVGDMTYTIRVDDQGSLAVSVYGRGFEHINITPRSSNEVRIWCEVWKPA